MVRGLTALLLLAGLQALVAWVTVHRSGARAVITSRPTLVRCDGRPVEHALTRQPVALGEVRQAVRATGTGDLGDVAAVVLESDGTLSVIPRGKIGDRSAVEGITGTRRRSADHLRCRRCGHGWAARS